MVGATPGAVTVTLTGEVTVTNGARVLHGRALAGRQGRVVLAHLAADAPRPVSRDELADALWGEDLPASWDKALASVISKLRGALEGIGLDDPRLLTNAFGCYSLHLPAGTAVEILVAGEQAGLAEHLLDAGNHAGAIAAASDAAATARRPLLPGDDGPWVESRRGELRAILLRALDCLALAGMEQGDVRLAVRVAQEAVHVAPFRETSHRSLMRALAAGGDRAEALRAHERCRVLLVEELGVSPSQELEAVYLEILRGDADARDPMAPTTGADEPAKVPPAPRPQLPSVATSFVGRVEEVAAVETDLAERRVLTLTGLGGVGKTRLAIEVARRAAHRFPDGVHFVDLSALRDPAMVVPTVAAALVDVGPLVQAAATDLAATSRALEEHLVSALAAQRLLVVLDNCEHLADECARLCTVLTRRCDGVTLLATSREVLGVPGELVHVVGPLSSDPADALSDAAALFLARARDVRPHLEMGPSDGAAVAEICRHLDGIPLAIELAAARLRVLTPAQIAGRLGDVFALLGIPARGVAARHRTLQATMQWSYGLLDDRDAAVLRRLSVFAGSCALEAAEAVCADDDVAGADVLDAIQRLTEKSLIVVHQHNGRARYALHEIVRRFAHDQLDVEKETGPAQDRHRDWFVAKAAEVSSYMDVRADGFVESEPDAENFRAAFRWSIDGGSPRRALRLATTLHGYWRAKNLVAVTLEQIEEALEVLGPRPSVSRASALGLASGIAIDHGDLRRALALAEESLVVAEAVGDGAIIGWMLLGVARVRLLRGELDVAAIAIEAAFGHLNEPREPVGLGWALMLRARALLASGDIDGMGRAVAEILLIEEASPQARSEAMVLTGLQSTLDGDVGCGQKWCEGGLDLAAEGMPVHLQHLLVVTASIDIAVGHQIDLGRDRLRRVFELAGEVRAVQFLPMALTAAAVVAEHDGWPVEAATLHGAAHRLRHDTAIRYEFRPLAPIAAASAARLHATLGPGAYRRATDEGGDLTLGAAVELGRLTLATTRSAESFRRDHTEPAEAVP